MKIGPGRIINDFIEPNKGNTLSPYTKATTNGQGSNASSCSRILCRRIRRTRPTSADLWFMRR